MPTRPVVVELHPRSGRPGSARVTPLPLSRISRDGHVVSTGPVVDRAPDVVAVARLRFAAMLAIGLGVAIWVDALLDGGFQTSVPVQSVEDDDAPRGDR